MTPLSTNFLQVLLPVPQFPLPSCKALKCLVKPTYHLKLGRKFSVLPMTESVSSWVHEAELVASFCFISREISVWKGSKSFPQCSPLSPFEENLGKHNYPGNCSRVLSQLKAESKKIWQLAINPSCVSTVDLLI